MNITREKLATKLYIIFGRYVDGKGAMTKRAEWLAYADYILASSEAGLPEEAGKTSTTAPAKPASRRTTK